MILKWLQKYDLYEKNEEDKDEIVYLQEELDSNLKNEIMNFEKECEQMCLKVQNKYQQFFANKGLSNLVVKVNRTMDDDEYDYLTEKNCFEETYESEIIIDYQGPTELKISGEDFYPARIFIWCMGRKNAYFCGKKIETLEGLANKELDDILEFIEQETK